MQNKTQNTDTPAFPPQLMQDNFGQVVALVPGLTKLEYTAIQFFQIAYNTNKELRYKGKPVNNYQAAVLWAKELFKELENQKENEESKLHILGE